jgi:hypothetical protein
MTMPPTGRAKKPGRYYTEGGERAHQRVECGEEQAVEDERRRRAVEEEVITSPIVGRLMKLATATSLTELVPDECAVCVIGPARTTAPEVRSSKVKKLLSGEPLYDSQSMHTELQEAIDLHESIVAEAGNALVGYETEKALANVVPLSEIPTTLPRTRSDKSTREPAAPRRPGRRQDLLRRHPRGHQQREVRQDSGPRRPAAHRDRRLPDDQPGDGEFITEFGPLAGRKSSCSTRSTASRSNRRARSSKACRIAPSPSARRFTRWRHSASRSRR